MNLRGQGLLTFNTDSKTDTVSSPARYFLYGTTGGCVAASPCSPLSTLVTGLTAPSLSAPLVPVTVICKIVLGIRTRTGTTKTTTTRTRTRTRMRTKMRMITRTREHEQEHAPEKEPKQE